MLNKNQFAVMAAFAGLACMSVTAYADDHAYTEGSVVNVARIQRWPRFFGQGYKWISGRA
jgi:hypothetical protein